MDGIAGFTSRNSWNWNVDCCETKITAVNSQRNLSSVIINSSETHRIHKLTCQRFWPRQLRFSSMCTTRDIHCSGSSGGCMQKAQVQKTQNTMFISLLMLGLMICSVWLDCRCETPFVTHVAETSKSANTINEKYRERQRKSTLSLKPFQSRVKIKATPFPAATYLVASSTHCISLSIFVHGQC